MKDEKYIYQQDIKEKKTIARGAFNKRSHCGKSGMAKWPSELMSKKELEKMNGELKVYKLNEPMKWSDFRKMPDDIKTTYIKRLREKYNCLDKAVAEMMDIDKGSFSTEMKRLGLATGQRSSKAKPSQSEKEAFNAWAFGVKVTEVTEVPQEEVTEVTEEPKAVVTEKKVATVTCGSMSFEGKTEDILESIAAILGGENVRIHISFDVIKDGAGE